MIICSWASAPVGWSLIYDILKVSFLLLFISSFSFAFAPCCMYFPVYQQCFGQHLITALRAASLWVSEWGECRWQVSERRCVRSHTGTVWPRRPQCVSHNPWNQPHFSQKSWLLMDDLQSDHQLRFQEWKTWDVFLI